MYVRNPVSKPKLHLDKVYAYHDFLERFSHFYGGESITGIFSDTLLFDELEDMLFEINDDPVDREELDYLMKRMRQITSQAMNSLETQAKSYLVRHRINSAISKHKK